MIEPRCSKCTRGWEIPEEKDMETKSRRHRRDIQRARLELPNFYLLLLCLSSLEVPFTLSERFVIASLIVRADGLGRRDRDKMLSLHREKPTGTCHAICWPEFDFAFSLQFFMYPVRFWIRSSGIAGSIRESGMNGPKLWTQFNGSTPFAQTKELCPF